MKTRTYIMLGTLMAMSAGLVGSAHAASMNKYAQYRDMVEATQGTSPVESHAWQHMSKYDREQAEANTVLPSEPREWAPKNYRNNF